MAFRITYQCNVEWIGPGQGPMSGALAAQVGMAPAGGAQTIAFFNAQGGQNSLTFLSADVDTLLTAMTTDLAAQMKAAATLARIQAFSTGTG
jgi:hypothetical protein